MSESKIQGDIMKALTEHPKVVYCFVTTTGTIRGKGGGRYFKAGIPGLPDIIGMLRGGKSFGIEVKKPGETPTQLQRDFIDLTRTNGGAYGWADNVQTALEILEF